MKRKTLSVLCADEPHHEYLVHRLQQIFDVLLVVIEPVSAQRRRALKEGRLLDFVFACYHAARRRILGLSAYRRRYFAFPPCDPGPFRALKVAWINDAAVADALSRVQSDFTIVMGTSILKGRVLEAAIPALNIHGGYLPYYRGNHCIFFALYCREYDKIGSTIHFIDAGIDTGDIVEHAIPTLRPNDNAEQLYCRAEWMAINRLVEMLQLYSDVAAIPRKKQLSHGRLFRTRDRGPLTDLAFWFTRVIRSYVRQV